MRSVDDKIAVLYLISRGDNRVIHSYTPRAYRDILKKSSILVAIILDKPLHNIGLCRLQIQSSIHRIIPFCTTVLSQRLGTRTHKASQVDILRLHVTT